MFASVGRLVAYFGCRVWSWRAASQPVLTGKASSGLTFEELAGFGGQCGVGRWRFGLVGRDGP